MSHYTNDIDALRELVSQALPALLQCIVVLISVLFVMLYFSVWMTLVLLCGVVCMVFVSKKIGGGSAKYFIRQQRSMGHAEGFIQEMMNGQKVIKVFNHEKDALVDFDKVNNALYEDSAKAHAFANTLGPIIGNIGNILYVIMAVVGGLFLLLKVPNVSLTGNPEFAIFSISFVVPFLNMAKQFTGNVNQASLKSVTADHLQAYADQLCFGGKSPDGTPTQPLSKGYLRQFAAVLQRAFKFAVFPKKLLSFNPMEYVVWRWQTEDSNLFAEDDDEEATSNVITYEQYVKLTDYLKQKENPALLPIQIAYYTGLRIRL